MVTTILLRRCQWLPLLGVWMALSGCSGVQPPPEEKLVPATGKVEVDGKPAGGVRIRFAPLDNTKSVGGAWAVSNDDGSFTVMHWTDKEGIAPGTYQVSFSKMVKPDGSPLGEQDSPAMVNAKESLANKWSAPEVDPMSAVERRVEIPAGGKSDLSFSVTTASK